MWASFHSVENLSQYSLNNLEFYLFLTKIIIFPFLDGYIIVISLLLFTSVPRPIIDFFDAAVLNCIYYVFGSSFSSLQRQCREPILTFYSDNLHLLLAKRDTFLFAHNLAFVFLPNFSVSLRQTRKHDFIQLFCWWYIVTYQKRY